MNDVVLFSARQLYYNSIDLVLLMFDVNNRESFLDCQTAVRVPSFLEYQYLKLNFD